MHWSAGKVRVSLHPCDMPRYFTGIWTSVCSTTKYEGVVLSSSEFPSSWAIRLCIHIHQYIKPPMDDQGIQETTPAFNPLDSGVIAYLTPHKLCSLRHDINMLNKLKLSTLPTNPQRKLTGRGWMIEIRDIEYFKNCRVKVIGFRCIYSRVIQNDDGIWGWPNKISI